MAKAGTTTPERAEQKATAMKPIGKKWRTVERKRYRYWRPEQEGGAALYGIVRERSERGGRFGLRAFYVLQATENTDDAKGHIAVGDMVGVNEYATLRGLADLTGKEVCIAPAGYDDRVKLFDVAVAE